LTAVPRQPRTTLTALFLASCLVISSAVPPPAAAGAPTDTMRDFFAAVNLVLADPRTEDQPLERLRAIRRHVDDVFDFREAAMLALGREWSARTAVEQNEFVVLFADLLERSFVWRVAGKAALGGGVKVHYAGETVEGDLATVETAVTARDGNDLRLEYRMVRRADRWVVRDVVMDGVSTMENYHAQFQRVVRDSSWRDLMSQLRAKVGAPPVLVAAPAPAPSQAARPTALVVGPPAPPEFDRSIPEDRQAIARDVAAVVTPGLAVRDVTPLPPLRQPAPDPERRVAPAPAPVAPVPPASASGPAATLAALGKPEIARPSRPSDADRLVSPVPPRAAPTASMERARTVEPVRMSRPQTLRAADAAAFWIQVGAYRNATMAGRVAERVKGVIVPSAASGESLLRVRVGPFTNRAQAASRLRQFQALGYQPFVAVD
jgi:phospholipid transport system substrate-binding protein